MKSPLLKGKNCTKVHEEKRVQKEEQDKAPFINVIQSYYSENSKNTSQMFNLLSTIIISELCPVLNSKI